MFFFNRNKKIKVIGKLIRFDIENNKHYPVFNFTTIEGKNYELRNIPKEDGIEEASLEDVYIESGVIEKLNEPLPIRNIIIKYNPEDPTDFIPRWI